ncbi:spermatogenesis-associated protein 4 [Callorhinchus milii]|nr:spermatogenesis-associated protein 4 [Callorhinchus milii]|eukprot:gi/632956765/ref/XP_007894122.1/ PREDICTED: spermatogenesis-associated protein 4 [Callorhinchus milii]
MRSYSESVPRGVKTEKLTFTHQAGQCCRPVHSEYADHSTVTHQGIYYPPLQSKTGIAREVYKWLQSLDLSVEYTNIRRDFSNGFLVAEIFSRYFTDASTRLVTNGVSLTRKMNNWYHLENFFKRRNLSLPRNLINGTVHRWPGAAESLIQYIHNMLTNRKAKLIMDDETDFMDSSYQNKLPAVARSTAAHAIRSNYRSSEMALEPDTFKIKQKTLGIINVHMQHRQTDKMSKSKRFHKKPTLGEQAVRLALPAHRYEDMSAKKTEKSGTIPRTELHTSDIRSKINVQFKEVSVKQIVRHSIPSVQLSTALF